MKRFYFILLFLTVSLLAVAQTKYLPAFINDPDGYTNVRQGKSSSSAIVSKIYKNEGFYVRKISGNWWPVYYDPNGSMIGYMHKSRIRLAKVNYKLECCGCRKKGVWIKCPQYNSWYCSPSCAMECDR